MNEIEEMRDALDRAELNLIRFRWIITHPGKTIIALTTAMRVGGNIPSAELIVAEIDNARAKG